MEEMISQYHEYIEKTGWEPNLLLVPFTLQDAFEKAVSDSLHFPLDLPATEARIHKLCNCEIIIGLNVPAIKYLTVINPKVEETGFKTTIKL